MPQHYPAARAVRKKEAVSGVEVLIRSMPFATILILPPCLQTYPPTPW